MILYWAQVDSPRQQVELTVQVLWPEPAALAGFTGWQTGCCSYTGKTDISPPDPTGAQHDAIPALLGLVEHS